MQTRLLRMAYEKWNKDYKEMNEIFHVNKVYEYISDLWGLFHCEGDNAVFEDIENYLKNRGVSFDSRIEE